MKEFVAFIIFIIIVAGIILYLIPRIPRVSAIFSFEPGAGGFFRQYKYAPPATPYFPSTGPYRQIQAPQTIYLPDIPDYLIPGGFTRAQLSPYFKKVNISSAYASFWGDYPGQIRLHSNLSKGEVINITGWRLRSNKGEIIIPQAVNIYEPSGFAPQEDIVLSTNSNVNIYSNQSPISRNLRINKCIGYLENTVDFNPPLPQNCPSISRSGIAYLSGQCQSYIFSLGGCKLPEVSFYNSLPGTDEGNACRQFLSTINHSTCFQKHRFDSDFLSNEWWVWANQNILDPQHDRLRFFDKQGLLADEYVY